MPSGACAWPKCERDPRLSWLGRWLCGGHWREVCGMLAKGRSGFSEAYDMIRVPKKWRLRDGPPPALGDLPDPDLFDYSA